MEQRGSLLSTAIVLIFAVGLGIGCFEGHAPEVPDESLEKPPRERTVVLYGYEFNPERIEIAEGTTVVFENKDPEVHHIDLPALAIDEQLEPGETYRRTFSTTGEFAVSNEKLDQPMRMTIVVE